MVKATPKKKAAPKGPDVEDLVTEVAEALCDYSDHGVDVEPYIKKAFLEYKKAGGKGSTAAKAFKERIPGDGWTMEDVALLADMFWTYFGIKFRVTVGY